MENNIPCICGHTKREHDINTRTMDTTGMCLVTPNIPSGKYTDDCFEYRQMSNLQYLEKLFRDKNLV